MAKTYYHRSTNLATGIHVADFESELATSAGAGAGTQISNNIVGGASALTHCFTTPSGEPNSADWPSGNYRCIFEVSDAGVDLSYGLRTSGSAAGHFARVNAGLTADSQTWDQAESLFTGTGVKSASTGTIDPSAGSADDRFECLIAASRPASHGNQNLTLVVNATDADATNGGVSDGPWVVAAVDTQEWLGCYPVERARPLPNVMY